jgi:hypothetical protein
MLQLVVVEARMARDRLPDERAEEEEEEADREAVVAERLHHASSAHE